MPDPRTDDDPTTTIGSDDDDFEVRLTYSVSDGDMNNADDLVTSYREIEAKVLSDDNGTITVELKVFDNTNTGRGAQADSITDHAGGTSEEFTDKVAFDKSNIPYYQDKFPDTHIPMGERIIPPIQEWNDSAPFRA